MIIIICKLL